jgi:hypothetical protein
MKDIDVDKVELVNQWDFILKKTYPSIGCQLRKRKDDST